MKSKNIYVAVASLCMILACSVALFADDIIVMRNGDVINGKVTEITLTEIKYKKASNPDGPTYTAAHADVLAINYENGEKETFEAQANQSVPSSEVVTIEPVLDQDSIDAINREFIQRYSQEYFKFADKPKDKKAKAGIGQYRVMDNSVVTDGVIRIYYIPMGNVSEADFRTKNTLMYGSSTPLPVIMNLTDHIIYVDLENTFIRNNGKATPLYTPSTTISSSGKTTGGAVNLGSVTGALGVGGAVGTLANGVNVGGSSSNSTTTVTYSQRIVPIPPKSNYQMEYRLPVDHMVSIGTNCTVGETIYFEPDNSPHQMGLYLTYGLDEGMTQTSVLEQNFYLWKVIGLNRGWFANTVNLSHLTDISTEAICVVSGDFQKR
ncbi:MAG: hypothetical protein LIO90_01085 [Bacteroidales bacterium]|nr:hypothetical protein [Bacteroidales bacterium]